MNGMVPVAPTRIEAVELAEAEYGFKIASLERLLHECEREHTLMLVGWRYRKRQKKTSLR